MTETTSVADADPTGSKRRTQLMLRPRSFWTTVDGSNGGGTVFGGAFEDAVSEAGTMTVCGSGGNYGRLAS